MLNPVKCQHGFTEPKFAVETSNAQAGLCEYQAARVANSCHRKCTLQTVNITETQAMNDKPKFCVKFNYVQRQTFL